MQDYCLYLNKAELIFFPPSNGASSPLDAPTVVQVVIKTTQSAKVPFVSTRLPWNRQQPSSLELSTFYLAQHEITQAVESVTYAHLHTPLPPQVRLLGRDYVLSGVRKTWTYGQRLDLTWGDQKIEPCSDKWIFQFKVVSVA